MDLDLKVLQLNMDTIPRRMKSSQGNRVKKYRSNLVKAIQRQKIVERLQKLLKLKDSMWRDKHTKALLQLDQDITKIMLRAEKNARQHTLHRGPLK